ncbi:hypothetical protein DFA_06521 [Cavenderia fasciculata]|uniref:Uncharacterized protein n=1 Tax=Cavenderia fasciculata TaxID=261658 RepID=F4PJ85_CACFS|nr:uncharacterized protein DFA_06521 [Cavenderia fasciculata]EGG24371.1 hypothetical protein DFA_06521 [Cavenderia fasciculata]|eukprot:XP_004362222.1 hypothetical protein DFA_06521 [Cavenderia fasciculata]
MGECGKHIVLKMNILVRQIINTILATIVLAYYLKILEWAPNIMYMMVYSPPKYSPTSIDLPNLYPLSSSSSSSSYSASTLSTYSNSTATYYSAKLESSNSGGGCSSTMNELMLTFGSLRDWWSKVKIYPNTDPSIRRVDAIEIALGYPKAFINTPVIRKKYKYYKFGIRE